MRTVNAIALAFVATAASGLAAQRAEAAPSCKPPRVLVVLDKSSSMLGDAGGASKWSTATSALASRARAAMTRMVKNIRDIGHGRPFDPDWCRGDRVRWSLRLQSKSLPERDEGLIKAIVQI